MFYLKISKLFFQGIFRWGKFVLRFGFFSNFEKCITNLFLGPDEQFPEGFQMALSNSVYAVNRRVPDVAETFERVTRDSRLGRIGGDGSKLASILNCQLVDGKPNFYGIQLMSPLDLARQDQSDQFVSPADRPVDFEGHNKNRHEGARLFYEVVLDHLNVVIDDDGYLQSFGPIDRKLTLSLGLGHGRDCNTVGPPFQVSHACVLMNGGFAHDSHGQG